MNEKDITERVAHLEGRIEAEERSAIKRISLWGSLIAIVFTTIIGMFQIYDHLVLRKSAAIEADLRQLGSYVRRITELNTIIVRITAPAFAAGNTVPTPAQVAEIKLWNAEKSSLLKLADRLLIKRSSEANFATFRTFSFEHLNVGNNAKALEYARQGKAVSSSFSERTEAQRFIARSLMVPGTVQDIVAARAAFNEALAFTQKIDNYLKPQLTANVYGDWISGEVMYGDCSAAKKLSARMAEILLQESFGPAILDIARGEILMTTAGATACRPF